MEITKDKSHISVCICTYKRPELLRQLLIELGRQDTAELFGYSIVVADNDRAESARSVVRVFSENSQIAVNYCVEPEQNIALARNKALENASGDFVAFIDDDELPARNWLLTLFETCNRYRADGVLGPVKPRFEHMPPQWVMKGKFYERPTYETGFVIDWKKGRTGNVLLRKRIIGGCKQAFRTDFLTGEDQDFFRRMIEKGHVFIWCNEAVAYELVPPVRWSRWFMLRRALLRGKIALVHPSSDALDIAKSLVAIPMYTLLLPIMFLLGQHVFMKYLIKIFDHLGKIFALIGIDPIKEQYVTE